MSRKMLTAVALAEQPRAGGRVRADASAGGWRGWVVGMGGWPALGGIAAAGLVGFWIGFAPPAALAQMLWDTERVELWPEATAFGFLIAEEGT